MKPRTARGLALVLAALALWLVADRREDTGAPPPQVIEALFERGASGVFVEALGVVDRLLPDDNSGSRHQRFVVRLASGHTVLISHNIDLAPRVENLAAGDSVSFLGEYEWNERGGVIHWTHHDPDGRRAGGWVRAHGREYR
ncbi:MAG: DUF3465 domain-containing protein [Gemmatimonadota bacterium]